jgi:hypothetical protein
MSASALVNCPISNGHDEIPGHILTTWLGMLTVTLSKSIDVMGILMLAGAVAVGMLKFASVATKHYNKALL